MKPVRALLRATHRALTDENVDLWLLTAAAAVFTVLGIVDVADAGVLSSAILALLAALAFAQIKSRKLVAQGSAGPIMHFEESASPWFTFYERQSERLWEAGTPWPLS